MFTRTEQGDPVQLEHEFTVPASVDECWAAFNHLELIATCLPGMTLRHLDGHEFDGTLKVKLGTLPLAFAVQGRFTERHLGGRHTTIEATGTDGRGHGRATVSMRTSFAPAGDECVVEVATEVRLTGQVARFDDGVLTDAADRLIAQFRESIAVRFAAGLGQQALAADQGVSYAADLGALGSSPAGTYTYNPPRVASQNDYEAIRAAAPVVARRLAPALLGALVLFGLLRRFNRR